MIVSLSIAFFAGTTLRDILTPYRDEITPKKKGAQW